MAIVIKGHDDLHVTRYGDLAANPGSRMIATDVIVKATTLI